MATLGLNYFDVVFAILLLWSAYRGITKGFLVMAASLAALVLGVWGAIRFSDLTAGLLIENLGLESRYTALIAFAITFTVIVIGVHLLARAMDKLVKAVALGFLNRLAGLAFAVLRTAFVISIILVILNSIDRRAPFIPEEHKDNSLLYKPLSRLAPAIFPYLNFEDMKSRMDKSRPLEYETRTSIPGKTDGLLSSGSYRSPVL
jgi:membrane protein required for colicin V production